MYEMITILGPTASGKTSVACALASDLDTEIISADSRQVYKGMDIGTGKDLSEYVVDGKKIPYHLIDIVQAGEKYNVYEFQHDFHEAYSSIQAKEKTPVFCGGTGLYIESVLKGYRLLSVPENPTLRRQLAGKSLDELTQILASYKQLHNTTDLDSAKRAIRAIEIEEYLVTADASCNEFEPINSLIVGIDIDRELRRKKISQRLQNRLEEGLIEEVQGLLNSGITAEDLLYYGLEYKFVTQYLLGKLNYEQLFTSLEIAIHQFAKRQMTWFRGMERRGFSIFWLNAEMLLEDKLLKIKEELKK